MSTIHNDKGAMLSLKRKYFIEFEAKRKILTAHSRFKINSFFCVMCRKIKFHDCLDIESTKERRAHYSKTCSQYGGRPTKFSFSWTQVDIELKITQGKHMYLVIHYWSEPGRPPGAVVVALLQATIIGQHFIIVGEWVNKFSLVLRLDVLYCKCGLCCGTKTELSDPNISATKI